MRVISGIRRGKKLLAPAGTNTRPTLDRVKQKMFDCIQFDIADQEVLDLFAGSGQLGLEALSRGAKSCHFNDSDAASIAVVQKNIQGCGFEKISSVTCNLYTDCVTICKKRGMRFSLVLLDPPYDREMLYDALMKLRQADLLQKEALILCEYSSTEEFVVPEGYVILKEKRSGYAAFAIVQKEE